MEVASETFCLGTLLIHSSADIINTIASKDLTTPVQFDDDMMDNRMLVDDPIRMITPEQNSTSKMDEWTQLTQDNLTKLARQKSISHSYDDDEESHTTLIVLQRLLAHQYISVSAKFGQGISVSDDEHFGELPLGNMDNVKARCDSTLIPNSPPMTPQKRKSRAMILPTPPSTPIKKRALSRPTSSRVLHDDDDDTSYIQPTLNTILIKVNLNLNYINQGQQLHSERRHLLQLIDRDHLKLYWKNGSKWNLGVGNQRVNDVSVDVIILQPFKHKYDLTDLLLLFTSVQVGSTGYIQQLTVAATSNVRRKDCRFEINSISISRGIALHHSTFVIHSCCLDLILPFFHVVECN